MKKIRVERFHNLDSVKYANKLYWESFEPPMNHDVRDVIAAAYLQGRRDGLIEAAMITSPKKSKQRKKS